MTTLRPLRLVALAFCISACGVHRAKQSAPPRLASPDRVETTRDSRSNPEAATFGLAVPGFDDRAIVFLPQQGRIPPPLVVVAHGAGVVPADICDVVRILFRDRVALLCLVGPRIALGDEGRYFPDHFALERLFLASLDAFTRAHPGRFDGSRAVYMGYSQGATMGALMLAEHGDLCPRLLLVEGGFSEWSLARARRFKARGGERVLFACGTKHCRDKATASAALLQRTGVDAHVVSELSAGHSYGGALAEAVAHELTAFLSGDERF